MLGRSARRACVGPHLVQHAEAQRGCEAHEVPQQHDGLLREHYLVQPVRRARRDTRRRPPRVQPLFVFSKTRLRVGPRRRDVTLLRVARALRQRRAEHHARLPAEPGGDRAGVRDAHAPPRSAVSPRSACRNAASAALVALYAAWPGAGHFAAIEHTAAITPVRRASMPGNTAFVSAIALKTLISNMSRSTSSAVSSAALDCEPPATWNR